MKFTDLFVHRPVLASVVSLLILLVGIRAIFSLEVRQYPETKNTVVTVSTAYPGASSDLIKGFITTPLQQAIAEANGIDYLFARSTQGSSTIEAHMELNYDSNAAVAEIQAKVASQRNVLPAESEDPVIDSTTGETTALMYLAFYSDSMKPSQITDYLLRVAQPKLQAVPGVAKAELIGNKTFAMRIWLDPQRMAALGVTANDVRAVLQANNYLAGVGQTKGPYTAINLSATTDLATVEDFRKLVVRSSGGTLVRLDDISSPELGAEDYDSTSWYKGKPAIFVGIKQAPGANPLDVATQVRKLIPQIREQLPEGLQVHIPYDASVFIEDSINEVFKTLLEAVGIVLIVVYLSLGSLRAAVVPAVAVPLSLVGGAFLMLLMGFSVNLLTLLAMVLAIGIVVDDAIIVLENVHRHVEEGLSPKDAALKGARELAWPVVAMTTTLVAVYLPIGFMGGLTGTLFVEFAFSLAGAVLLSGVVALTLSPMMCAKILKAHDPEHRGNRFEAWLNRQFEKLAGSYERRLHGALNDVPTVLVFGLIILVSCYFLFVTSPSELEPKEDQGFVLVSATADPYVTLDYLEPFSRELEQIAADAPAVENIFLLNGLGGGAGTAASNTALAGFVLDSWNERDVTTNEFQEQLSGQVNSIAGLQSAVFVPPSLPSGGGMLPVEFVIGTTEPTENLQELANQILGKAQESRKFIFLDTDLKIDKPRYNILIDREKAASLGITMRQLAQELGAMLSGAYANRFSLENRSYKVIPQVQRSDRLTPEQLQQYYIRTGSGDLIPLATLVRLEETVQPQQLKRFQQLNSVTISGVQRPGVTLGEALGILENAAQEVLPPGYSVDYSGQSRQFKKEGSDLMITFFFALIVIYLVLAAQFESFRDPIIMLITVPMSVCGAMIFVSLGLATLNIYTQVGLVTLIGVISKHGILIVEFANKMQEEGMGKREAIEHAAAVRLRPVLMTTAALVLAMIPLLIAAGPGGGARFAIGLVVAAGMTIGTLFTLFVVPAMYMLLGRNEGHGDEGTEALPEPAES